MDIESSQEDNEIELDIEPLTIRTDKKLVISNDAEHLASDLLSKRSRYGELNKDIDPSSTAQKLHLAVKTRQFGRFEHFLTKNKHRDTRVDVLNQVRELATERGIVLSGRMKDKLERSRMIVRVVSRQEGSNIVVAEDETGKQKVQIRNAVVWIGMITCFDVSWTDGQYRLDALIDLGVKIPSAPTQLRHPNSVYRLLFLKAALWRPDTKDNLGLRLLTNELRQLKFKERSAVDCIVIMGPLLSIRNSQLRSGFSELTYEEEAAELVELIHEQVSKINEDIELIFVPSTDDIVSLHPIPQPKYSFPGDQDRRVHYTSNPSSLTLQGSRQDYNIDLINSDLLYYIDQNKTGRAGGEILMDNLDAYFKQPFLLTNAHEQPFDETNLPGLFNKGLFGDIIVTSSERSPPYAREVKGRVFANIGSLGIEHHETNKHFMTLMSIYDGEGPVGHRTKVETLSM